VNFRQIVVICTELATALRIRLIFRVRLRKLSNNVLFAANRPAVKVIKVGVFHVFIKVFCFLCYVSSFTLNFVMS